MPTMTMHIEHVQLKERRRSCNTMKYGWLASPVQLILAQSTSMTKLAALRQSKKPHGRRRRISAFLMGLHLESRRFVMPSIVHCLHMQEGKVILPTDEGCRHCLSLGLKACAVVTCRQQLLCLTRLSMSTQHHSTWQQLWVHCQAASSMLHAIGHS